jgi:hypothetical protein
MDTNTRHQFRIRVVSEEGAVFGEVGGEFEQGRPAGMPAGTTQRVMIAANIGIRIEHACEAAAELWLDGTMDRSVPFRIVLRKQR